MKLMLWRPKLCLGLGFFCLGIALVISLLVVFAFNSACTRAPCLPTNLSVSKDGEDILISWSEPALATNCSNSYMFRYSMNGWAEIEIATTNLSYRIRDVFLCSNVVLLFWTVSESGKLSDEYLERNYTVNATNQPVAAVDSFDTSEGVVVTWYKPLGHARCDIRYSVTVKTKRGVWMSEMVDVERILIPWDAYCLLMEVIISSWINGQLNYDTIYHYTSKRTVEDIELKTSLEDPEELIVNWRYDTHQALCGITYNVNYFAYDPALTQNVTTTSGEARFRFVYCMASVIVFHIININSDISIPQAYVVATQYPQNITELQGLTTNVTQENVIVVWLPVSTVETCNIIYRVELITDLNNFTYTNVTSPLQLPTPNYCSVLGVQVGILIGQHVVHSSLVQISENIDKIHDLKLEPATEQYTLLAKWTEHPKKDLCGLAYEVIYRYGPYFKIFTTNQSSILFDTVYCTDIFVEVAAVGGSTMSERSNATYKGYPDVLEQVYNITMSLTANNTLSVSWVSPPSISQCNILYNVTATNANGRSGCIGTSDCEITLSSFCPSTEIYITANYLDVGAPISAEPSDIIYDC